MCTLLICGMRQYDFSVFEYVGIGTHQDRDNFMFACKTHEAVLLHKNISQNLN